MKDNVLVNVKDVSMNYGSGRQDAVEHVSLDIRKGEILAFVGSNGSGKSTLMKGILKLMPITCGEIERRKGTSHILPCADSHNRARFSGKRARNRAFRNATWKIHALLQRKAPQKGAGSNETIGYLRSCEDQHRRAFRWTASKNAACACNRR